MLFEDAKVREEFVELAAPVGFEGAEFFGINSFYGRFVNEMRVTGGLRKPAARGKIADHLVAPGFEEGTIVIPAKAGIQEEIPDWNIRG